MSLTSHHPKVTDRSAEFTKNLMASSHGKGICLTGIIIPAIKGVARERISIITAIIQCHLSVISHDENAAESASTALNNRSCDRADCGLNTHPNKGTIATNVNESTTLTTEKSSQCLYIATNEGINRFNKNNVIVSSHNFAVGNVQISSVRNQ